MLLVGGDVLYPKAKILKFYFLLSRCCRSHIGIVMIVVGAFMTSAIAEFLLSGPQFSQLLDDWRGRLHGREVVILVSVAWMGLSV